MKRTHPPQWGTADLRPKIKYVQGFSRGCGKQLTYVNHLCEHQAWTEVRSSLGEATRAFAKKMQSHRQVLALSALISSPVPKEHEHGRVCLPLGPRCPHLFPGRSFVKVLLGVYFPTSTLP